MKWHKLTIFGAIFLFCGVFSIATFAQQATVNLSTTITGNQEQPRVLYIVPWQSVNDSELEDMTIQSQLNVVFGHVEKIELQRELSFMKELAKKAEASQN